MALHGGDNFSEGLEHGERKRTYAIGYAPPRTSAIGTKPAILQ
jgi:hypothetical protein